MTMHLSSQEFVNALEALNGQSAALAPSRQAHLDGCEACQTQLTELRAVVADAALDAEVPEPSPLFWEHFQGRVLVSVKDEELPAARSWWAGWTGWATGIDARTVVAVSAMAVAVAASAALYLTRPIVTEPAAVADTAVVESGAVAEASTTLNSEEWDFVTSVIDDEDVHEVLAPTRNAVDAAIETLTRDERERLMKLLEAEIGQGTE